MSQADSKKKPLTSTQVRRDASLTAAGWLERDLDLADYPEPYDDVEENALLLRTEVEKIIAALRAYPQGLGRRGSR